MSKTSIEVWAVAYIDVMGMTRRMCDIDFDPEQTLKPEQEEKLRREMGWILGVISDIREGFKSSLKYFEPKDKPSGYDLPEDKLKVWRTVQPPRLGNQWLSDGLVLFMSLKNPKETCRATGLFAMLMGCASAMLSSLITGFTIRGGLDIGLGSVLQEGEDCRQELIGPAIVRAYELERKIADYPRIVVGERCVSFLNFASKLSGEDAKTKVERNVAEACLGMIGKDVDGQHFIDFLGEGCHEIVGKATPFKNIERAFSFVNEQLINFRNAGDDKLTLKYSKLLVYFLTRMQVWDKQAKLNSSAESGSTNQENGV